MRVSNTLGNREFTWNENIMITIHTISHELWVYKHSYNTIDNKTDDQYSNKDPCSYHKSAVNTSLTNLSIHWNHKHIRRSGTSDWTKTNRINIQIMVGISYLLLSDLLYTSSMVWWVRWIFKHIMIIFLFLFLLFFHIFMGSFLLDKVDLQIIQI